MLAMSLSSMAESDRDCIRHGNHLYNEKDFENALGEYTKAIGHNADNAIAYFNSGCVQIQLCDKTQQLNEKLKADSAAVEKFQKAVELFKDDRTKRGYAYHNIGVIYHKEYYYYDEASETFKKQNDFQESQAARQNKITALQQAIDEYKRALRCNPKDDETRYNLALCQYLLKKNQQNDNGGGQNQNKDKNKDNKDQDKQNQNQDKNKNDNEDKKNKNNNNNQPQPKDGQMSKQNAQQLLQAARQQEQETQQRLKRGSVRQAPAREKNW